MEITTFEVGPFLENTYLIVEHERALLIDPGFSTETEYLQLRNQLTQENAELRAVVLTHAHVDHVMGLQRVLEDFPVEVYLNRNDLFLWNNFGGQTRLYGLNHVDFSFLPKALPADEHFTIDGFQFECLYTPGHSPDHTSLYFEKEGVLFAGDAIFKDSIGRTDLYKGDFDLLAQSIQNKIYRLPDQVTIYPGHGPITSVGREKLHNPFVRAVSRKG